MIPHSQPEKPCAECRQPLTFEEFCRINPSITPENAIECWEDPMILIFCADCYFKLPERPFKRRRGYFNHFSSLELNF